MNVKCTTSVMYFSVEHKTKHDVCMSEHSDYILVTIIKKNLSSDLYCCSSSYSWISYNIYIYIYIYIYSDFCFTYLVWYKVVCHSRFLKPDGGVSFIATMIYVEIFSNKCNFFHTKCYWINELFTCEVLVRSWNDTTNTNKPLYIYKF
jgi:hypothetical protein